MTIGQEIKQMRKLHNMSQKELAEKLGINKQRIVYWESNRGLPTFNELIVLRAVFHITTDNLLGDNEIITSQENSKLAKGILLTLFILSFFCLPFSLYLVSTSMQDMPGNAMTEYMWLCYLLLPIPVASVVMGVIYRRKGFKATKNIVVGVIFTFLLIIYGSFTFIFNGLYSHDYSYVHQIETEINFDLPELGRITTEDYTEGSQNTADSVQYLSSSEIYYTDTNEISALYTSIESSKLWVTSINTSVIPPLYSFYTYGTDYHYFMVYNIDHKNYNTVPDTSGIYQFIFLAYDDVNHKMKIGKYTINISIN